MRRFDLHQALAEKKTRRLILTMVVMQILTVVFCAAFISLTLALIYFWWNPETAFPNFPVTFFSAILSGLGVTVILVTGGYLKMSELDGGGSKVAESLRGDLINESSSHLSPNYRRLLNIVQELAIASSIAAPKVYVLAGEPGINAMAVGHDLDDAVIIVTGGAVHHLSRDQMQGVIAHEFSHILNGDISRDMWLTAATHGNYFLLLTAQELASHQRYDGISFESYLGYMLYPFGVFGAALARFFTARIKRQNEFNADATAVELARYPNGLSDALMMIGGFEHQGRIKRAEAIETGHMFLVDSGWSYGGWFWTHPPLDQRILRLRPDWDGLYLYENTEDLEHYGAIYNEMTELVGLGKEARRDHAKKTVSKFAPIIAAGVATKALGGASPASVINEDSLDEAGVDGKIPPWMAHDPLGEVEIEDTFRALVKDHQGAGLTLAAIRLDQFETLAADKLIAELNPLVAGGVTRLLSAMRDLNDGQKMWMFDRSIETIITAPTPIRQLLMEFVDQTEVACEHETDWSRWAWQRIVNRRLNPTLAPTARFGDLQPLYPEIMILLSAVTHTDAEGIGNTQYNFMRAIAHTEMIRSELVPVEQLTVTEVEGALELLSYLSARQRRVLVLACSSSIFANQSTNLDEAWMIRAICDGFNFPMPSLLPGQDVIAGV